MALKFWRTEMKKMLGFRGSREKPTFHIDALFLPESSTQILYLGSEGTLDVFSGKGLIVRFLRVRRKGM